MAKSIRRLEGDDRIKHHRYAMFLVRRWARSYQEAHECRDEAIRYAREYGSVAEIAAASGLRRQSIYKILERPDKPVDKDAESA